MDIHLVGGFLGSGKTTAIVAAARRLIDGGRKVGVVTNDQGRSLVDSAFVRSAGLPAVEVTGGCFCCNFDDFASLIVALGRRSRPDVVFAESVGSCADLVATVIKPLVSGTRDAGRLCSLSVFGDARLLDRWIDGRPLPFSDSVSYIFGKQLEEAGAIVINKADLMSEAQAADLLARTSRRFPDKAARLQSSLCDADVDGWLRLIEAVPQRLLPRDSLAIDYERYGAGEAELAWLDARIMLRAPAGRARAAVEAVIAGLCGALGARGLPVGHLKILVEAAGVTAKLSVTAADSLPPSVPDLPDGPVSLLVNARAQTAAEDLRRLLREVLEQAAAVHGLLYELSDEDAFSPAFPRPTHRIA